MNDLSEMYLARVLDSPFCATESLDCSAIFFSFSKYGQEVIAIV